MGFAPRKRWDGSGVAGAYTASIPFKPLIYIGAILFTPWVADNVARHLLDVEVKTKFL